jgi:hypothetical protein
VARVERILVLLPVHHGLLGDLVMVLEATEVYMAKIQLTVLLGQVTYSMIRALL